MECFERIVAIIDAAGPVEPPSIPAADPKKRARGDRSGHDQAVSKGRTVRVAWAPDGGDSNDKVRESDPDRFARIVAIIDAAKPVEPPSIPPADPKKKAADDNSGKRKKKRPPKKAPDDQPSRPAADGEPPKPNALGYSVEELNREYALVLMGAKAVIFLEQPLAPIEDQKRMLSIDAFKAWHANRFTQRVDASGNLKTVTWSTAWLSSRQRRQYKGIEFFPDRDNAPGVSGYLNLWSGFAYEPAAHADPMRYKTFRDHLVNNVCHGDRDLFAWVFGFFAHIVQRPRERIGVALVLRGHMGTGKTKVGEIIGQLFPRHYFLVDDPRYVTGQFNAHMASCLLLQADEAVWAGDKAAEGRLKGLITSPIQQVEAKGIDPIRLLNYVRLVMTSNEEWVVPAGKDERRFAVLDVDPRCAQNHDYFREMDTELANGGYEHLLADLLAFDIDSVDLRKVPRTEALLEQKILSLPSVDGWWFSRLRSGQLTSHAEGWDSKIPCAVLFNDYIHTSEKIGVKRKQEETVFGIKLSRLVPRLERKKCTVVDSEGGDVRSKRVWCYVIPPLADAREHFEQIVTQAVPWPDEGLDERDSDASKSDEVRV